MDDGDSKAPDAAAGSRAGRARHGAPYSAVSAMAAYLPYWFATVIASPSSSDSGFVLLLVTFFACLCALLWARLFGRFVGDQGDERVGWSILVISLLCTCIVMTPAALAHKASLQWEMQAWLAAWGTSFIVPQIMSLWRASIIIRNRPPIVRASEPDPDRSPVWPYPSGYCQHCAYDLTGLIPEGPVQWGRTETLVERCPECGNAPSLKPATN